MEQEAPVHRVWERATGIEPAWSSGELQLCDLSYARGGPVARLHRSGRPVAAPTGGIAAAAGPKVARCPLSGLDRST